jgi:hypothetical protein
VPISQFVITVVVAMAVAVPAAGRGKQQQQCSSWSVTCAGNINLFHICLVLLMWIEHQQRGQQLMAWTAQPCCYCLFPETVGNENTDAADCYKSCEADLLPSMH